MTARSTKSHPFYQSYVVSSTKWPKPYRRILLAFEVCSSVFVVVVGRSSSSCLLPFLQLALQIHFIVLIFPFVFFPFSLRFFCHSARHLRFSSNPKWMVYRLDEVDSKTKGLLDANGKRTEYALVKSIVSGVKKKKKYVKYRRHWTRNTINKRHTSNKRQKGRKKRKKNTLKRKGGDKAQSHNKKSNSEVNWREQIRNPSTEERQSVALFLI